MDVIEQFPKAKKELEALLEQAGQDNDVLALILFGSAAKGEVSDRSDIDVCLVLRPKRWDVEELAQKRFEYLHFDLDVKLFQQLPLYVRSKVLREGVVLLVKDEDQLYEIAIRTAKEFEDFKHIYHDYLEAIAND
jgi:hypothetical protein